MVFAGFLLGLVLGSFIKVLADRSLRKVDFGGRSYCIKCKKTLKWCDLFPVVSYILLQGKCRYCRKKIGIEYPIVEIVTGLLVGFLFWQSFLGPPAGEAGYQIIFNIDFLFFISNLAFKVFFICVLIVLTITDIKKMLIPDRIILSSIIFGVVYMLVSSILKVIYIYYALSQSAVGKFLLPPYSNYFQRHSLLVFEPFLYSILMAILIGGFFYLLIIITKGRGMGGGDVKLGAFLGLILGFPASLTALMLAFISGSIVSLGLVLLGKKGLKSQIAFGPFLVFGSLAALFWGKEIIDWYLHLSI